MAWLKLCHTNDLTADGGTEFALEGRVIAVFYCEEKLVALDGMCAHQGGPIAQGQLDGRCVTCPWHGWQYDVTTGCNLLTGKKMLDSFEVELREDEVWVKLE